jgi:Uma2 family endonuclease
MSIISTTKMTARQFLELGEDPPGVRLELVNGEIAVSPSPIPDHSYTLLQLGSLLVQHVKTHAFGRIYLDVDTILDEFDVRRPDLIYFSKERLHLVGDKAMEGAPDLCVEILSPSSITIDRRDKFKQYEKAGVKFYWLIDPKNKTIEGYKLTRGKYHETGRAKENEIVELLPFDDLKIPLGELWQPK